VWDAAYTAYRFVPLSAAGDPAAQAARLRLFVHGYGPGLGGPDDGPDDGGAAATTAHGRRAARRTSATARVLEVAVLRLRALVAHIRERAAAGDPAFRDHLAAGHDRIYLADIAHIEAHARRILATMPA
jgi:hypothetical protein